MATQNIPFSFTNGTNANANEVNSNFQAIKTFNESQVVHVDGAVKATTASINDSAITTAKIADGNVTTAKFASGIEPVIVVATVGSLPTGVDGMVAYVNSNNSDEGLYTYNGTAWRKGASWNAAWGSVGTSTKTSNQTLSSAGTYVDVTGMSVTWTAVGNRLYHVKAYVLLTMNSAGFIDLQLTNGAATQQYQQVTVSTVLGAGAPAQCVEFIVSNLAAGSTTIKLRARPDVVTPTAPLINGSSTAPSFMTIVDLGPSGNPT